MQISITNLSKFSCISNCFCVHKDLVVSYYERIV